MSLMLAAAAGISAASGAISNIALPPNINLQSSLHYASSAILEVNSNGMLAWTTTEHATQQFPWNEGGRFNNQYQVRLSVVAGPTPTGPVVNEWLDIPTTGSLGFGWERTTLGTTTGSYVLEIQSKITGRIVASSTIGLSLEYYQADYGIVLPASLNLSTTGTTARYVNITLSGNSNNLLTTDRNGTVANYNWNPVGHNRNLFHVRLVHTSGTAPGSGSGTGSWRAANVASNWRWDRSAVGTTSGGVRLEIRDATTNTLLAQCPITVSLVMESTDSQHTMTVGDIGIDICIPDPKGGGESCGFNRIGYGYNALFDVGAISPNTYKGAKIHLLYKTANSSSALTELAIEGILPKNFFTSVTSGGVVLNSSTATHTQYANQNYTAWSWSNTNPAWVAGQNVQVTIK